MRASVVVVGAGMAGAHVARSLAEDGVDVLVLEAGPRRTRADNLKTFYENPVKGPQAPYPSMDYAPHPEDSTYDEHYVQAGPDRFIGAYLRLYGGTSWHWTGFADRLRPVDFTMRSSYGVADDWPLGYDEILPYYEQAERRWGVAGDDRQVWGAPRGNAPYQMPPIPVSYMDAQVDEALQTLGLHSAPFSHARNSVVYDERPACCGNNTCVPLCPIGAKYDASVDARKAEAAGARIETEALVTFVELGDGGKVRRLKVRRPNGETLWVDGDIFVLGCHAIENPRLLLNSRQEAAPNGVANGSGAVGRYLLTQANQDFWGLTPKPVYPFRGPQQTAGIVEMRDGDFRRERAAIGTSFMNSGWSGNSDAIGLAKKLIADGMFGQQLASEINNQVSRHLRLNSSAEVLPDWNNRIELDETRDTAGVPKPRITFKIDDYTRAGLAAGLEVSQRIFKQMGVASMEANEPYGSNAIIGGTTRMGNDARSSVVDRDLVSHQHRNLYILGSSSHITAPVNAPSLTIAALAIRAAGHITSTLKTIPR
jgi:choline dehydrogenase-like flavoprotein